MQSKYLSTSTNWPDELFGGASPVLYTGLLNRKQPNPTALKDALVWQQPEPDGTQWAWASGSPDGRIQLSATVDVTDQISTEQHDALVYRAFCLYLITRLDDKSVIRAYETLLDLYSWQQESARTIPSPSTQGVLTLASMPRVERTPFVIDSEP